MQYTEGKSCRVNRGRCFLRRKEGSGLGQSCTEPGGFGEEDVWGGRRLHRSDAKFKSGLCAPLQQSSTLSHAAPLAPPLPPQLPPPSRCLHCLLTFSVAPGVSTHTRRNTGKHVRTYQRKRAGAHSMHLHTLRASSIQCVNTHVTHFSVDATSGTH